MDCRLAKMSWKPGEVIQHTPRHRSVSEEDSRPMYGGETSRNHRKITVMPAKAGIQLLSLDSVIRRNDNERPVQRVLRKILKLLSFL